MTTRQAQDPSEQLPPKRISIARGAFALLAFWLLGIAVTIATAFMFDVRNERTYFATAALFLVAMPAAYAAGVASRRLVNRRIANLLAILGGATLFACFLANGSVELAVPAIGMIVLWFGVGAEGDPSVK